MWGIILLKHKFPCSNYGGEILCTCGVFEKIPFIVTEGKFNVKFYSIFTACLHIPNEASLHIIRYKLMLAENFSAKDKSHFTGLYHHSPRETTSGIRYIQPFQFLNPNPVNWNSNVFECLPSPPLGFCHRKH